MQCGASYGLDEVLSAPGVPHCRCGGIIKPDVVLYEEPLDETIWRGAQEAVAEADVMLVGGTSLSVYPAAGLIQLFSGEPLVLINKSATPYDSRANLLICGSIGQVLSKVVERLNG
jgi:NAD-dependent deacetylase